ncbi:hypothetical protein AWC31_09115 [Mycolicibacterium wolinskyi]|uniref:Uncharacterized protein n=1 Tax=Mycolicibacterium wolinskyi TaxID=59750 RepID=A0A1X2ETJ0_9MYCO|nr:hypothetical protein AWC31_09115 [Mycolicibacterium wolinskyi]
MLIGMSQLLAGPVVDLSVNDGRFRENGRQSQSFTIARCHMAFKSVGGRPKLSGRGLNEDQSAWRCGQWKVVEFLLAKLGRLRVEITLFYP